jgi:hypothetical protein
MRRDLKCHAELRAWRYRKGSRHRAAAFFCARHSGVGRCSISTGDGYFANRAMATALNGRAHLIPLVQTPLLRHTSGFRLDSRRYQRRTMAISRTEPWRLHSTAGLIRFLSFNCLSFGSRLTCGGQSPLPKIGGATRPATLGARSNGRAERVPTVFLGRNFAGFGGTPIPEYR